MVLCGLLVMLLKLYLYTKSLNVGYWPTAAVAASRFEATDFTLLDQSSERRDCAVTHD